MTSSPLILRVTDAVGIELLPLTTVNCSSTIAGSDSICSTESATAIRSASVTRLPLSPISLIRATISDK